MPLGGQLAVTAEAAGKVQQDQHKRDTQHAEHHPGVRVPEVAPAVGEELIVADEQKQTPPQEQADESAEGNAPIKRLFLIDHRDAYPFFLWCTGCWSPRTCSGGAFSLWGDRAPVRQ